jgi:farnesyl diphosphate synthase
MSDGVGFVAWRAAQQALVERALNDWVPPDAPAGLGLAMRYAVLDGGKRLRPLLVLAACEAVQGHAGTALRAACAVELIHAYSLVHDDMPCMDNDVLRRGKPTVHVQFGEAPALLAGAALQALAFELLVPDDGSTDPALSATLCRQLAQAAGAAGMAGGQAIDLASVGSALDRPALEAMHRCKTGALLQASVMMGAATGRPGGHALACLRRYGDRLGLAFQVVDDILDVTTDSVTLGKTAGKDAASDKPTFVSLMGLEPAQSCADRLPDEAHEALRDSGLAPTDTLHALADWVGRRVS